MKTALSLLLLFFIVLPKSEGKNEDTESDKQFLLAAANTRSITLEAGRLANEQGTMKAIRDYGSRMIEEQTMLLEKIKQLMSDKQIEMQQAISNKKAEELQELRQQTSEDFDFRFIQMMVFEHKRAIRLFKKAAKSEDEQIKTFALEHLPLIQSHLQQIRKIRRLCDQAYRISAARVS